MVDEQQIPTAQPPSAAAAGAREERPAEAGQASEPEASREQLALMLEDARARANESWNDLLRVRAELENYRKRAARDVENAQRYGIERLVSELLPVRDSMEMGAAAAAGEGVDPVRLREGIDLTLRMLGAALEKFAVMEVTPRAGDRFNPELHQAMSVQAAPGLAPGTVAVLVRKGYTLHDRLLRPAMVVVAREPVSAEQGGA